MSNQLSIDFIARQKDGMRRAEERANREDPGWSDQAEEFLAGYASPGRRFMAEDVVAAALEAGLGEPPDRRAWGPIFQRLSRRGVIRRIGYSAAATSNGSAKPVWEGA